MSPELIEVKRWLEKADHDRRIAELALAETPPITDVGAFHAQQAAEKLLKAFLVFHEEPFEKIHDLEELVELCTRHDAGLNDLRDRVGALTPYAVRYRYPGPSDPTVEQVREALAVAEETQAMITERLPSELRGH